MDFVNRELTCIDCGAGFVFTAGEQHYFQDKQFKNDPKRCRQCRAKRNSSPRKPVRAEIRTTCAECGSETTVPFIPFQGRPVLCLSCFKKKQPQSEPAELQHDNAACDRLAGAVISFPTAQR